MSIQTAQSNVNRVLREIADLQKRLSDETKQEVDKTKRSGQVQSSITKTMSSSMLQSKRREMTQLADDISRIQVRKADISRRIADKTTERHRYEQELLKEQERERKKIEEADKKREREQQEYRRSLSRELVSQRRRMPELLSRQSSENHSLAHEKKSDLFISHASEDKENFVRPLAEALERIGVVTWYDELQLTVGDSLRRSIDHGLANSLYGVVVLSSHFFAKQWPQYELDGLVAREMNGAKVILPIWHKVSKDEVMSYSPTLADRVALNSSMMSIDEIRLPAVGEQKLTLRTL